MTRSADIRTTHATPGPGEKTLGKANYRRIVVKLGSNLLTGGGQGLNMEGMASLVGQVARLHRMGVEVLVVTSGAIASGRALLDRIPDHRGVPLRQVLASVGQGRLMQAYDNLFGEYGITVAQALVSRGDLSDRLGYLNVRNTLNTLLDLGVVPIINENDVVAVEEIQETRFGDNDNLSAMVANLVDADLLMLLTDTAGLYTADPHQAPDATLISRVEEIDGEIEALAGGTGNPQGVGGMVTKVQAARLATASGVEVVIADGREEDVVLRLARGESLGTHFPASTTKMESRKRWMLSGLNSRGALRVDLGAARALMKGGKSLLPAGVVAVEGEFQRGDVVSILDGEGTRIACGLANYDAGETAKIKGAHSREIQGLLGHEYGEEVVHRSNLVLL
ncbi:MAG: glutamate 5-kinase [Chloroflexi bacterium]|nr:glutamate 5-kinase [Chloroflexota bacterium]